MTRGADVRVVTWTAAVSQLVVVLVPLLAGVLVVLAAVAGVAFAALALVALLLDRDRAANRVDCPSLRWGVAKW